MEEGCPFARVQEQVRDEIMVRTHMHTFSSQEGMNKKRFAECVAFVCDGLLISLWSGTALLFTLNEERPGDAATQHLTV